MKQRTLVILGGAAALSLLSAPLPPPRTPAAAPPRRVVAGLLLAPGTPEAPAGAGKLAFEGLASKLGGATRIEIGKHDGRLVLERKGDAWGVADRGGYPARPGGGGAWG